MGYAQPDDSCLRLRYKPNKDPACVAWRRSKLLLLHCLMFDPPTVDQKRPRIQENSPSGRPHPAIAPVTVKLVLVLLVLMVSVVVSVVVVVLVRVVKNNQTGPYGPPLAARGALSREKPRVQLGYFSHQVVWASQP